MISHEPIKDDEFDVAREDSIKRTLADTDGTDGDTDGTDGDSDGTDGDSDGTDGDSDGSDA